MLLDKLCKKDILIRNSWQCAALLAKSKERKEKAIAVKLTPPFV